MFFFSDAASCARVGEVIAANAAAPIANQK
jgi:hypothetical protein